MRVLALGLCLAACHPPPPPEVPECKETEWRVPLGHDPKTCTYDEAGPFLEDCGSGGPGAKCVREELSSCGFTRAGHVDDRHCAKVCGMPSCTFDEDSFVCVRRCPVE